MNRTLVSLSIATLAGAALLSGGRLVGAEGTAASPIDTAVKLLEAGKFDEALESARAVPEDDAARPKARYLVGEILIMTGDTAGAESAFREALDKKPEAAAVLAALGHALLAQSRAEDAVAPLEKAVAADAKSARARAWLGLARARSGKAEAGRKDLVVAAKLDPQDPEVARVVVEERLDAQDVPGATKAAAAFAAARKDHPMGPFLLAYVLDRSGKFDDAIAGYEKTLALDPAFLDAHKDLAILCVAQNPLYQNVKRTKKAMEHFAAYQDKGGRDATVLQIYAQLKSFLEANGGSPTPDPRDGGTDKHAGK